MREALARSDRDFLSSEDAGGEPSHLISTLTLVLRRPIEVAGVLAMTGFTLLILANALVYQKGAHPAPFFGREGPGRTQAAVPTPAPVAPARQAVAAAQDAAVPAAPDDGSLLRQIQGELAARGYYDGVPDGVLGRKSDAAIRAFQTRMGLAVDGQPSEDLLSRLKMAPMPQTPPARDGDPIGALINASTPTSTPVPVVRPAAVPTPTPPTRRLLAIEKALATLGYGPLKVDGVMDADTRGAISRFERDRSLPVTGQVSARLVKELSAVSGVSLE